MSSATLTASASTRNPFTDPPSLSRIVPIPSGAGILATKSPKPPRSSVQISALIAEPAPSATRNSRVFDPVAGPARGPRGRRRMGRGGGLGRGAETGLDRAGEAGEEAVGAGGAD